MRIRDYIASNTDAVDVALASVLVFLLAAFALMGYVSAAFFLLYAAGCLVGAVLTYILLRLSRRRRLVAVLLLPVLVGVLVAKNAFLDTESGPEELIQGLLLGSMMLIIWGLIGAGSHSAERDRSSGTP